MFDDHAVAIDQDGLLWSWGSNAKCKAGHPEDVTGKDKPCKIKAFEELNLKAVKVSCGKSVTLVQATDQSGLCRLYSIGKDEANFKNLGCSAESAKTDIIRKVTNLADLDIIDFSAASNFSMIIMKGD